MSANQEHHSNKQKQYCHPDFTYSTKRSDILGQLPSNILGYVVKEEDHLRKPGTVVLLPVDNGLDILLGDFCRGRIGMLLCLLLDMSGSLLGHLALVAVAAVVVSLLLKDELILSHSWLLLGRRL